MLTIILTLTAVLTLTLAGGLWVGLALGGTGTLLLALFRDIPLDKLLAQYTWNILTTQELLALPMFIAMGEILFRTKLSQSLFNGLAPWAGLLPGRLLHVNIIGSTLFAAISGSSAATTQVVGRISLAELIRRGYSKDIAIGSLAGAGTLGFLLPPSSIMIVYGVLADVSILKLFIAGVIPAIILAAMFMSWVMIHSTIRPELVPASERQLAHMPLLDRFRALKELAPVIFLIGCTVGSMYTGLATPSESAAVGVVGAIIVAQLQGGFTRRMIRDIALGSVQTCAMIAMILLGASIISNATAFLGIPRATTDWVAGFGLSPVALIAVLVVFYLIIGSVLDGFSMMVLTLPIVLPVVKAAGFDPVWFGVFMVVVIEMAQISPPVGFNLFIIQNLTNTSLSYVSKVALPYMFIMAIFAMMLAVFPQLVLWLPVVMGNG
jgi:tripartite ATP-independent transporter DctM subunit